MQLAINGEIGETLRYLSTPEFLCPFSRQFTGAKSDVKPYEVPSPATTTMTTHPTYRIPGRYTRRIFNILYY